MARPTAAHDVITGAIRSWDYKQRLAISPASVFNCERCCSFSAYTGPFASIVAVTTSACRRQQTRWYRRRSLMHRLPPPESQMRQDATTPRQPKTTIADIASRLVQLERTIVAIAGSEAGTDAAGDDAVDAGDTAAAPATNANDGGIRRHASTGDRRTIGGWPAPVATTARSARSTPQASVADDNDLYSRDFGRDENYNEGVTAAEEILLKNSYASRYINEVLLSRVLEEEQEFRSALTSPKESEADDAFSDASYTAEPAITIFGTLATSRFNPRAYSQGNGSLHPPKAHALQLWHKYIQTVEPMNKVLHVPTDEIDVFTAIDNPDKVDPAFESLLFSVYFSTVTVYQPEQYRATFGESKMVAADRFRAGMERALVQARFLESPSLRTLQALTLFLRSYRAHSPGRAIWIMYGMVLRAAQSIGLHRDGANFNLPPFESEMRRRVWAHMIGQDGRAAEDHGIDISLADAGTDIRLALNVNDTDIHPGMTALPAAQLRWTEMTMNVCMQMLASTMSYMTRLINAMKVQAAAAASAPPDARPFLILTEERRSAIMAERNRYVNELMQHCSLVVPVQRATYKIVGLVQRKCDFVCRLQLATFLVRHGSAAASSPGGSEAPMMIATEENLRRACEVIELNVDMMKDEKIQDFQWSAEMFPQFHALLYTLWHMCVRPISEGNAALWDRAWAAVDGMFAMEVSRQQRQNVKGGNAKWAVLAVLREKAQRLRNEAERGASGGTARGTHESSRGAADPRTKDDDSDTAMADSNTTCASSFSTVQAAIGTDEPALGVPQPFSTTTSTNAPAMPIHPPQQRLPLPTTAYSHTNTTAASPLGARQYPMAPSLIDAAPGAMLPTTAQATSLPIVPGTTLPTPSDVPPSAFLLQDPVPDADMIEFLGDTTLGMGMDVDWVRGFMGWNTGSDDFRWRGTYDSQ
ncbi:zinc c6 transcription factor [Ophiostoma piceae UAMH 11346]|uniref:Zinc c6 transcription factor n=1 Tax=Ophiostoma piceae (strain UAMH 11346) TaxID=1262450 RepID=S3CJH4_OPHP1|nr:zinc c6 transcription factor [Ophiostoma piceae UAMH 11346]